MTDLTTLFILTFYCLLHLQAEGVSLGNLDSRHSSSAQLDDKNDVQSCFEVLRQCKGDHTCRKAFNALKRKCAVESGSCNARMRDLSACADIMDTISKVFFKTDQKCVCQKKPSRCATIHERVYNNPCFPSVRYLRAMNQFPKLDQVTNPVQPPHAVIQPEQTDPKSRDILEELLAPFYASEDYMSDEIMTTSPNMTQQIKQGADSIQEINNSRNYEASEIISDHNAHYNVTNSDSYLQNARQKPKMSPGSDVILLHIVAIVTGILVLVTISIGIGLLFHFRSHKKARKSDMTSSMT